VEGQVKGRTGGGRDHAWHQQGAKNNIKMHESSSMPILLYIDSAGEHPASPRGHPFPAPGTLHGALPRELLLRGRDVRLHSQLQGVLRRDRCQQAGSGVPASVE